MTTTTPTDLDTCARDYREHGYCVVPGALGDADLDLVRGSLARLLAAEIDDADEPRHRFVLGASGKEPALRTVILGSAYAAICRALLGDEVWLINDQFSHKPARTGGVFRWHQDGAYIGAPHRPYLTTVLALEDLTQDNGSLRLVPRDEAITRETVLDAHTLEPGEQTRRHFGDHPGVLLRAAAGSLICFASDVFHRSDANRSDRDRTTYVAQYAVEPRTGVPGQGLCLEGEPFLRGGGVVAEP